MKNRKRSQPQKYHVINKDLIAARKGFKEDNSVQKEPVGPAAYGIEHHIEDIQDIGKMDMLPNDPRDTTKSPEMKYDNSRSSLQADGVNQSRVSFNINKSNIT